MKRAVKNSVRNARGSFTPTTVRGVRGEDEFWRMVDGEAERCGLTRNGLIVAVLTEYCKGKGGGKSGDC